MRRRRIIAIVGAGCALLLAGGAVLAWWAVHRKTPDVHRGDALPFTFTQDPTVPSTTATSGTHNHQQSWGPAWPVYGRTMTRTRDASDLTTVRPPYKVLWKRTTGFLEYPPSYAKGRLYLYSNDGQLTAYDVTTGKRLWHHYTGPSGNKGLGEPAVDGNRVYVGSRANYVYSFHAKTGSLAWRTNVGAPMESSPAFNSKYLFMSDLNGNVRALDLKTGRVVWTFHAAGAVKHGPALAGGRLYFGDYAGVMYCLRASDGHLIWRTATHGLSSGFASGTFYSTPAVAYGRVYIGNTDDKVYSFVAATGQIAWTYTLPWWAYGSPAVSDGRIFATGADGTFVAFNARTGGVLWRHKLPHNSLASPVVVGPYVYVADRGASGRVHGDVYAFNPGTGRRVWSFPDGKYSSVIAADGMLVIAGFGNLYVLRPVGH
ncbi:MAG TPA: PQQ-binding-like beta-propeller repeat protein [Gaiellales bacterium]|nr:PQQ-binding-like beta-propeller repeat protein [Gaiellales bacterium]